MKRLIILGIFILCLSLTAQPHTADASSELIEANSTISRVPTQTSNCTASPLGIATSFNIFMLNDIYQPSSDTEGRMAAGGDITLSAYSVGYSLDPATWSNQDVLIAGGDLNFDGGRVYHGSAAYGVNANVSQTTSIDGGLQNNSPVNFAAAATELHDLTDYWATLTANGNTHVEYWGGPSGQITLTGNDPDLNVFDVSGADVAAANTFTINAPASSTVIVNIDGDINRMRWFGFFLNGINEQQVIYNFYETTELLIQGIGVEGAIMAPYADIEFTYGNIDGTLIGNSLTGIGESHHYPSQACPPMPEDEEPPIIVL